MATLVTTTPRWRIAVTLEISTGSAIMRNFSGTAAWISSPSRSATLSRRCQRPCEQRKQLLRLVVVEAGRLWLGPPNHSRPCVPVRSLLSDDDPTGPEIGGQRTPPGSVGREARVGTDGSARPLGQPSGSVGRAFRPKICFAALRAAGRSIGGTESETPSTLRIS